MGGTSGLVVRFPTLLEAFKEDPNTNTNFVFEFTRLQTQYDDPQLGLYKATFWVTGDALKYRIPKTRKLLYEEWNKNPVADLYDPQGEMLCRLPCQAADNQAVADLVTTHPDPLKSKAISGLINFSAEIREDMKPEPSLLLTPRLCDLRYRELQTEPKSAIPRVVVVDGRRKMQVTVYNQDPDKPIVGESLKLHIALNKEINATHAKGGGGPSLPSIIADAGKIWAVTNDIYREKTRDDGSKYKAVSNYGWHQPNQKYTAVSNTAAWPLKLAQPFPGTAHDGNHVDYSQMAYLVAGWCEITEPKDKAPKFVRTEKVYTTKTLCNLVVHDGNPLTVTRY